MKNWEYYEDDIKKHGIAHFAIKKDNIPIECSAISCDKCKFDETTCSKDITKFLYEEHKEPVKLTRLEFELLTYFSKEYSYIARDEDDSLIVYIKKPIKRSRFWNNTGACDYDSISIFNKCFRFIKWEDKEPYKIQDILDNYKVVEDE